MTAFFIVGWVFSIYWAYLIVVKAFNLNNKDKLDQASAVQVPIQNNI